MRSALIRLRKQRLRCPPFSPRRASHLWVLILIEGATPWDARLCKAAVLNLILYSQSSSLSSTPHRPNHNPQSSHHHHHHHHHHHRGHHEDDPTWVVKSWLGSQTPFNHNDGLLKPLSHHRHHHHHLCYHHIQHHHKHQRRNPLFFNLNRH